MTVGSDHDHWETYILEAYCCKNAILCLIVFILRIIVHPDDSVGWLSRTINPNNVAVLILRAEH